MLYSIFLYLSWHISLIIKCDYFIPWKDADIGQVIPRRQNNSKYYQFNWYTFVWLVKKREKTIDRPAENGPTSEWLRNVLRRSIDGLWPIVKNFLEPVDHNKILGLMFIIVSSKNLEILEKKRHHRC